MNDGRKLNEMTNYRAKNVAPAIRTPLARPAATTISWSREIETFWLRGAGLGRRLLLPGINAAVGPITQNWLIKCPSRCIHCCTRGGVPLGLALTRTTTTTTSAGGLPRANEPDGESASGRRARIRAKKSPLLFKVPQSNFNPTRYWHSRARPYKTRPSRQCSSSMSDPILAGWIVLLAGHLSPHSKTRRNVWEGEKHLLKWEDLIVNRSFLLLFCAPHFSLKESILLID